MDPSASKVSFRFVTSLCLYITGNLLIDNVNHAGNVPAFLVTVRGTHVDYVPTKTIWMYRSSSSWVMSLSMNTVSFVTFDFCYTHDNKYRSTTLQTNFYLYRPTCYIISAKLSNIYML